MIGVPRRNTKINLLQGPLLGPFFLERNKMAGAHSRRLQLRKPLPASDAQIISPMTVMPVAFGTAGDRVSDGLARGHRSY
jgi:hypothetical protein